MFDRSAITEGRLIQEFGLCDLKGVYQNTAKLRAKGWLAVLFFDPTDPFSASAVATLQEWATTLPADKVSLVGVGRGEKPAVEQLVADKGVTFTTLWDFEDYTLGLWGVNELPTLFVTDARGLVLARIVGDDQEAFAAEKAALEAAIQKAAEAAKAAAEAAAAAKAAEEAAKAAAPPPAPPAPAPEPAKPSAVAEPPSDVPTPVKPPKPEEKKAKKK